MVMGLTKKTSLLSLKKKKKKKCQKSNNEIRLKEVLEILYSVDYVICMDDNLNPTCGHAALPDLNGSDFTRLDKL